MKLQPSASVEICILAGGLSRRMGRDKSRLKLGRRTMLGQMLATAKSLGLPVRVIRRDAVARCGPLGGIYTALKTTQAEAVLFLACDMPFVTEKLLRVVLRRLGRKDKALFTRTGGKAGFPFVLHRDALAVVARQIEDKLFSLQALARALKARSLRPPPGWRVQLRNVNTPAESERARQLWVRSRKPA